MRRAKQERVFLFVSTHFLLLSFCFSICNTRFSHMSEESLLGATTVPSQLSLPDCHWGLRWKRKIPFCFICSLTKMTNLLLGDVRIAVKVNQPIHGHCCMTSVGMCVGLQARSYIYALERLQDCSWVCNGGRHLKKLKIH